MGRQFVFTMSTGRNGTAFLAELMRRNIAGSEIHHEIIGFDSFGVDTPDLSHLTFFNSKGSVSHVNNFWKQKFSRVLESKSEIYGETSHILLKAGLVENLDLLRQNGKVCLINLQRDTYSTIRSFVIRRDFYSSGQSMMWYLVPTYPKNIYKMDATADILKNIAWYITEMRCRFSYYKALINEREDCDLCQINFDELITESGALSFFNKLSMPLNDINITIPPQMNVNINKNTRFSPRDEEAMRKSAAEVDSIDTESIGREAFSKGFRFQ